MLAVSNFEAFIPFRIGNYYCPARLLCSSFRRKRYAVSSSLCNKVTFTNLSYDHKAYHHISPGFGICHVSGRKNAALSMGPLLHVESESRCSTADLALVLAGNHCSTLNERLVASFIVPSARTATNTRPSTSFNNRDMTMALRDFMQDLVRNIPATEIDIVTDGSASHDMSFRESFSDLNVKMSNGSPIPAKPCGCPIENTTTNGGNLRSNVSCIPNIQDCSPVVTRKAVATSPRTPLRPKVHWMS